VRQYDYDVAKDRAILAAVVDAWKPPPWAEATAVRDGQPVGNCIRAGRFACTVLTFLNVQCEMAATRVDAPRSDARHYSVSVGWGDCRTYAVQTPNGFAAHAVVIGHDWLFDAAAGLFNEPGPVIASQVAPGQWLSDGGIEYTWAPGLRREFIERDDWGAKAPARRIAAAVRRAIGPCNPPRAYAVM